MYLNKPFEYKVPSRKTVFAFVMAIYLNFVALVTSNNNFASINRRIDISLSFTNLDVFIVISISENNFKYSFPNPPLSQTRELFEELSSAYKN